MRYFRFILHGPDFLLPCTLPYALKRQFFFNLFNCFSLKEKKFQGDNVKNEGAKITREGGGRRPQPV